MNKGNQGKSKRKIVSFRSTLKFDLLSNVNYVRYLFNAPVLAIIKQQQQSEKQTCLLNCILYSKYSRSVLPGLFHIRISIICRQGHHLFVLRKYSKQFDSFRVKVEHLFAFPARTGRAKRKSWKHVTDKGARRTKED